MLRRFPRSRFLVLPHGGTALSAALGSRRGWDGPPTDCCCQVYNAAHKLLPLLDQRLRQSRQESSSVSVLLADVKKVRTTVGYVLP